MKCPKCGSQMAHLYPAMVDGKMVEVYECHRCQHVEHVLDEKKKGKR